MAETPVRSVDEAIDQFDDVVDRAFDRLRGNAVFDRMFYTASALGDWSLIWQILGTARGLGPAGFESTARQALALGAESALVNGPVKSVFDRRRPLPDVERPYHLRTPRTSSFPSGHASSAVLAAGLLSENSPWAPLYIGVAAVVATSRIHVQIHHASDVVAGALLGAALVAGVRRAWPLGRWP